MPCATSAANPTASPPSRWSPTARSAARLSFRTSEALETFQEIRRETFLLRGRTLADFINKTKTEKWKALVEILGLDAIERLREDLQRARNDLRKKAKGVDEEVKTYQRALASGSAEVNHETVLANLQEICGVLGVDPPQSLDQVIDPSWLTRRLAPARACPKARNARDCWPRSRR